MRTDKNSIKIEQEQRRSSTMMNQAKENRLKRQETVQAIEKSMDLGQ